MEDQLVLRNREEQSINNGNFNSAACLNCSVIKTLLHCNVTFTV